MALSLDEGIDNLCERLQRIDLEQEEILVEPSLVEEVLTTGKTCILVKLLSQ